MIKPFTESVSSPVTGLFGLAAQLKMPQNPSQHSQPHRKHSHGSRGRPCSGQAGIHIPPGLLCSDTLMPEIIALQNLMGSLHTLIPLTVISSISQLGLQARTLVFPAPASARSNKEQGSKQGHWLCHSLTQNLFNSSNILTLALCAM